MAHRDPRKAENDKLRRSIKKDNRVTKPKKSPYKKPKKKEWRELISK